MLKDFFTFVIDYLGKVSITTFQTISTSTRENAQNEIAVDCTVILKAVPVNVTPIKIKETVNNCHKMLITYLPLKNLQILPPINLKCSYFYNLILKIIN